MIAYRSNGAIETESLVVVVEKVTVEPAIVIMLVSSEAVELIVASPHIDNIDAPMSNCFVSMRTDDTVSPQFCTLRRTAFVQNVRRFRTSHKNAPADD